MGPAITSLPAAAKAGAQFMEGFNVKKVVFAEDGVTAVGVEGVWTARGPGGLVHMPESERLQRRVIVKAKKVVIAGGALYSPLVLMQSGVEVSQQIVRVTSR
jgi:flavin-dependent dehydrogenase